MDGKEFLENEDESQKKQWMRMKIEFGQAQDRMGVL